MHAREEDGRASGRKGWGRRLGLLAGVATGALTALVPADAFAALEFERRVVDGRFSSGGEVVLDERRRLVLTADRDPVNTDAIRPGVSVVDADRLRFRRTIPFWTQPPEPVTPPAGGPAVATPQVPSGIDADARRGLIVTSNSQTDAVSIASVAAPVTSAANRVRVGDHPFGVAIDERSGLAYVAMYGSGRIDVIDVRTRRVVRSIDGLVAPTKLALDERTSRLYVGNADRAGADHAITVIDTRTDAITARIPVDPNSRPTLDAAAGRLYAASFETGRVAVIYLATNTLDRWIDTGSTPHGIAVDERSGLLLAPNLLENTVTVIDRTTLTVVATEPVPDVPLGIAVDPRTGWSWISSRDASTLTLLRPTR